MAAPSIQSGRTFGRYRLLEQIGAGGMGVVYRAHDERLARDVAIKLLNPGSIRSAIGRHRVRNEAMALSRLSHPNIETIFEFDSLEDCDCLVVELISGVSLDDLVARGPIPQTLSVSLAIQLLRGLAAAHEKGIIHRDLKPSNLKLTSDSFLKILDFGLAHCHDDDRAHDLTTETHSTVLSGTLAYMSPEQLRNGPLDPRNDLYAAGLILYQMCAGRLPFDETGALLIDAILNRRVPPPRKFNSSVDPRVEKIILKALEKDPKVRYQSAREMLHDLEVLGSPALVPHWQRQLQIAVLALVTFAIVFLATIEYKRVFGWIERQLHPVPANKYVAVMPFRSVTNDDSAFDQGLTDAVATRLMESTAAQNVQVVSPRELRSEHVTDLSDARRKLGVNLAIEGTLQQLEGATRVNLGLVDANTHRLLSAANFSVNKADAFALQDQVIDRTVQLLEIEMHTQLDERTHGTTNPEAFTLYTRGVGFLENERHPEDIDSAIGQFEQALKIDPGFAAAYAKLGTAYIVKYRETRDTSWIESSRTSCEKSLSLDSQSVQGLMCLGTLHLRTGAYQQAASDFGVAAERDPANDEALRGLASAYEQLGITGRAEEAYKKAVELRPGYAIEHQLLGFFYSRQAKYDLAADQFQQAANLNPDDPRPWEQLGGNYLYSGQYDKSIETLQHAISIRPSFRSYSNLGSSYIALRRFPEAIVALNQSVNLGPNEIQTYGNLGRAYFLYPPTRSSAREPLLKGLSLAAKDISVNPNDTDAHLLSAQLSAMLGRKEDALKHLDAALKLQPNDAETLYYAAIVHCVLGNTTQAAGWLAKAIQRGYSLAEIQSAPELDPIRNEPEIKQLISSLNHQK